MPKSKSRDRSTKKQTKKNSRASTSNVTTNTRETTRASRSQVSYAENSKKKSHLTRLKTRLSRASKIKLDKIRKVYSKTKQNVTKSKDTSSKDTKLNEENTRLNEMFTKFLQEIDTHRVIFTEFSSDLKLFIDTSKEIKINCKQLDVKTLKNIFQSCESQSKSIIIFLKEILKLLNSYRYSGSLNRHINFILKQVCEDQLMVNDEAANLSVINTRPTTSSASLISNESVNLMHEVDTNEHLWKNLLDNVFIELSQKIIDSFKTYFDRFDTYRTHLSTHFTQTHGFLPTANASNKNFMKTSGEVTTTLTKSDMQEISCGDFNVFLVKEASRLNKLRKKIYLSAFASLFQVEHQFLSELSQVKLKLDEFVLSNLNKD